MAEPKVTEGETWDRQRGERDVAVGEFFHWIYRFFYSKTLGLILILLFAALAVVGSVIPQAAPGTYDDVAAKESFLNNVSEVYGGWTPVLNALGFFHVFTSIGFYVIVGMLGISIAACTVHRIPELVKRKHRPRLHVAKRFFDRARYRAGVTTSVSTEEALDTAKSVLESDRFRVLPDPKDKDAFYADRFSWAGIGTVIAHGSFIIILLAFVVSSTWGVEEDLPIPVGGSVDLGHDTGLAAHAVSFKDTYTEDGQPADYVTELQLLDGGEVVAEQEIRVNTPLDYGGFRYHQSTFGIASDVVVTSSGGEVVYEASVPMLYSSNQNQNAVGKFDLPDTDLEVIVVTAASGATRSEVPVGAALFEVYEKEGGDPVGHALVRQGSTEAVGPYDFSFERERQYTGILMRQDPGTIWMWIGSTLLVVGMSITFLFPYRRLWVRVDDEGDERVIRLGAVARLDYAYQRLFEKIVEEMDVRLGNQIGGGEDD